MVKGEFFRNNAQTFPEKSPGAVFLSLSSGGAGAAERRQALLRALELPKHLSPNALLEVLNALYTYEEFCAAFSEPVPQKNPSETQKGT